MTNFEALVKNNPQYVKELLAGLLTLDILKSALTGELEHDICYKERDKREMDFLNAEYVAPVLDDIEKKYLSDVIRPFRDKVTGIKKSCNGDNYYICIYVGNEFITLPDFKEKSGMYKGMIPRNLYTLEELGL
jgi:hypothetical protein